MRPHPPSRPAFVPLCVLVSLVVAGCAGASSEPASTAGVSAGAPTPDAVSGSVSGTVVDEERQPVGGADVGLTSAALSTRTDASGAFTLNGVPAGSHVLVVQRLGFNQVAKRIEVRVGEVTTVAVTLAATVVADEVYTLTAPRTGHVNFGNVFLYDVTWVVNNSVLTGLLCDACIFVAHFPPKPKAALTETKWESGTTNAYVNNNVWLQIKKDWVQGTSWLDGTVIISQYFRDRQSHHWSEGQNAHLKGADKVIIVIYAGEYVTMDLRLTIYSTFAYNGEIPENFTALPPV